MYATFSAKNAAVRIVTASLTVVITAKKWTVNMKTDKLDTTNFEGGGYSENIPGIYSADFTIEVDENTTNYLTGVSDVVPGLHTYTTGLKLFMNGTSSPFWNFPSYLIESFAHNSDVRTTMGATITGCNHGQFYTPVGTIVVTT